MSITFPCPQCGQKYQVGRELAGKRMKCRQCGSVQMIPVPRSAPAAPFEAPETPARARPTSPSRPAFDPFADNDDRPVTSRSPSSRPPDDVYDLDDVPVTKAFLGESEVDDYVMPRAGKPTRPHASGSRSRGSDSMKPWWIAGGIVGGLFLVFMLLGIFSATAAMTFLVCAVLCGGLIMAGGGLWGLVNAFREAPMCGILHLIPLVNSVYPLYYLITRWSMQWRPFALQLGGMGVMIVGGGIGAGLLALHRDGTGTIGAMPSPPPSPVTSEFIPPPPVMPPMPPVMRPGRPSRPPTRPPIDNRPNFAPGAGSFAGGAEAPTAPAPNIPRFTPGAAQPAQPPTAPRFTPGGGSFAGGVEAPSTDPDRRPNTSRFTPGSGGFAQAAPAGWKAQADPAPSIPDLSAVQDLAITIRAPYDKQNVLFPTAPSEFVLVGRNQGPNEARDLWNLKQGKAVGRLAGKVEIEPPLALSADGTALAGRMPWKNAVIVLDLKKNKILGQIDFPQHKPDFLDFAGNDRLVLGFFWTKEIQVWDLKSGQQKTKIVIDPFDKNATAVSPGGKYVATISNHVLKIYETDTGQEVGLEPLPKGENNWDLTGKGLAFSPDGQELAALCEGFGKFTMVVWEVETGKQLSQTSFGERNAIKQPFGYDAEPLQWLPKKDGWLIYGEAIVERESGMKVETLPFDNDTLKVAPRKILSDSRVLTLMGKDGQKLVAAPLKTQQIAAAMKIAREGGNPLDAALPTVKGTDLAGARRVSTPSATVAWSAPPDPKPTAAKGVDKRLVTLKTKPGEAVRILFSSPTTPRAAISSQPDKAFGNQPANPEGKPLVIDRYDLTNGKHQGRLELAPMIDLVALSPDGSTILTWNYKDRDRLDAFGADNQSIAGWRPYDKATGDDRQILWADFLDANRVLSLNRGGTLVLWSLPDCKAEYVIEDACQGPPVFSPGRNFLALFRDGAFHLIDPATGETRGETSTVASSPRGPAVAAAAFRADGGELAAVIGNNLVRWDMNTGRGVAEFPVTADTKTLEYTNPNHILLNGQTLYDLQRQRVVWYYNGGVAATGSPDALHWLVLGTPFKPGLLGSLAMPEARVEQLVAQSENQSIPAILKAGTKVSVQLEFGNPPRDADAFRRKLTQILAGKLTSVGASASDGQPVRLIARITEKPTGETMEFREIGPRFGRPGPPQTRSISIRDLDCEFLIADAQGPLSIAKSTMRMRQFGIVHVPASETDIEAFMFQETWNGAQNWFNTIGMPSYVARAADGVVLLPGNTDLNQLVK